MTVRIISERPLIYTDPADPDDDRPDHVRAASAMAMWQGRIAIVQDDTNFIALVDPDPEGRVDAIPLPRGPGGRRRFEVAIGNKLDKLDLEACIVLDGELLAFGSGSLAGPRDKIVRLAPNNAVSVVDAAALYANLRAAIGGPVNIEGTVIVGKEVWLFHRGNTSAADAPAVAVVHLSVLRAYMDVGADPLIDRVEHWKLGEHESVKFGFTDACARPDSDDVFVTFAAEASADAIADGAVIGSRVGRVDGEVVRYTDVPGIHGEPLKIEAIGFDGPRLWLSVDRDDPDVPAMLYEAVMA